MAKRRKMLNDDYNEEVEEQYSNEQFNKKLLFVVPTVALLLVLAAVLTIVLIGSKEEIIDTAVEIGGLRYEIVDGCATVVGVTSISKQVIIPSVITYDGVEYSVTSIGESAFREKKGIESVEIPDSLTRIGNSAFRECSLESITIPDSLTYIGDYAFRSCSGLKNIIISNNVAYIGEMALSGCSNLTIFCEAQSQPSEWNMYWNPSNRFVIWEYREVIPEEYVELWYISRMSDDNVLAYLCNDADNEGFYTLNIIGRGKMKDWKSDADVPWYYPIRDKITTVAISQGITSIGNYAFDSCSNLTSIDIPDSVTSIGNHAFVGCKGLATVAIPEGVISIGDYAFSSCIGLESIVIPRSVKTIGNYAFDFCSGLENIVIPISVVKVGERAFYCCTSLSIYCEERSEPKTWNEEWNYSGCHVEWGYKG